MPTKQTLLEEKHWRTAGSNQQSLDHRPNALPTEMCQPIRSTGFNLAKYRQWIYITRCCTMRKRGSVILL